MEVFVTLSKGDSFMRHDDGRVIVPIDGRVHVSSETYHKPDKPIKIEDTFFEFPYTTLPNTAFAR